MLWLCITATCCYKVMIVSLSMFVYENVVKVYVGSIVIKQFDAVLSLDVLKDSVVAVFAVCYVCIVESFRTVFFFLLINSKRTYFQCLAFFFPQPSWPS